MSDTPMDPMSDESAEGPADGGALEPGRFSRDRVRAFRIGKVVVIGEPERRAGAGGASGGADAFRVDVPVLRLGAEELDRSGTILERSRRDGLRRIPIVDGCHRNACIEAVF